MKEPCSLLRLVPHPGAFEMHVLKALAHLREAFACADADNSQNVGAAICVLTEICRQKDLVAKTLEGLPLRAVDPGPRQGGKR